jgi:hypothetical protein
MSGLARAEHAWAAAAGLPWAAIAYMGLATTAFTLWVEMHALKNVSAPLAALIYTCALQAAALLEAPMRLPHALSQTCWLCMHGQCGDA